MMLGDAELALIICTRNRPATLQLTLGNLLKQSLIPSLIVIVDSSDSGLFRLAKSFSDKLPFPELHHIKSDYGAPHQKNVGINFVLSLQPTRTPRVVAFLDDDILPEKNYFRNLVELFQRNPDVKCLGGFDIQIQELGMSALRRRLLIGGAAAGSILSSGISVAGPIRQELEKVDWVPGGMQSYRAEVFRQLRFDGKIRIHGDEVELQMRLLELYPDSIATSRLLGVTHMAETAGKQSLAQSTAYLDGFRWRLAHQFPHRIIPRNVIFATLVLLAGEFVIGALKFDVRRFEVVYGHCLFLARVLFGRTVEDFVKHNSYLSANEPTR